MKKRGSQLHGVDMFKQGASYEEVEAKIGLKNTINAAQTYSTIISDKIKILNKEAATIRDNLIQLKKDTSKQKETLKQEIIELEDEFKSLEQEYEISWAEKDAKLRTFEAQIEEMTIETIEIKECINFVNKFKENYSLQILNTFKEILDKYEPQINRNLAARRLLNQLENYTANSPKNILTKEQNPSLQ